MAKINLLPWREERRAELKQQFFVVLAGAAIIGASAVFLFDMNVQNKISIQRQGNDYVKSEIDKIEKDIQEVEGIKKQRERLNERMGVIQSLQGNRSLIVHQFDELVRVVPDGVYFTLVEKKAGKFYIEGIADANNRVSNLMLNLDESDWFKDSILARVSQVNEDSEDDEEKSAVSFKLSVMEKNPKQPVNGES